MSPRASRQIARKQSDEDVGFHLRRFVPASRWGISAGFQPAPGSTRAAQKHADRVPPPLHSLTLLATRSPRKKPPGFLRAVFKTSGCGILPHISGLSAGATNV